MRLVAGAGLAATALASLPGAALGHVTDVAPAGADALDRAHVLGLRALRPARASWPPRRSTWSPSGASIGRTRPTPCRAGGSSPGWPGWRVIGVALFSFVDVYATSLFSVHMVQHLLLAMVGAPLLLLGAPITLLLRVASPETRQRRILPVLHSRPVRVISHPVVGWLVLAVVLWASHFSPIFGAALDDPGVHALRARALPRRRAALLVAGRRRRPAPLPDGPRHALRVRPAGDAAQQLPGPGALRDAGRPLRALRHACSASGVRRRSRTSSWPAASCGRPATSSSWSRSSS